MLFIYDKSLSQVSFTLFFCLYDYYTEHQQMNSFNPKI